MCPKPFSWAKNKRTTTRSREDRSQRGRHLTPTSFSKAVRKSRSETNQHFEWAKYLHPVDISPLPGEYIPCSDQSKRIQEYIWTHQELNIYLHPTAHSDPQISEMLGTYISHQNTGYDSHKFLATWNFWNCVPLWHGFLFLAPSGHGWVRSVQIFRRTLQLLTPICRMLLISCPEEGQWCP